MSPAVAIAQNMAIYRSVRKNVRAAATARFGPPVNAPMQGGRMNVTRRDFCGMAGAGLTGVTGMAGVAESEGRAEAQTTARPNRSFINGVQFGLQPFCYHDLAMTTENSPELV